MNRKKLKFTKKLYQRIVIFVVSFAVVVSISFIIFIWQCGYWENWVLLDSISGPKRFKEFIANPIPSEIYNIRGGYSGFPQGKITTYFQYDGLFINQSFLNNWLYIDERNNSVYFKLFADKLDVTRIYIYKDLSIEKYLLLDENKKSVILFVP
ncbi:MAG: hypothetical protein K8S23_03240 [Candidatus Cloacimonetes bacterium]|nr:hypothetical protein [Candidatus Cloacimonadota bacterium]